MLFGSRGLAAPAALAAAGGAVAGLPFLSGSEIAGSAALAALMAAIAAEDLRRLRVPDALNALTAAAGLAFAWISAAAAGGDALPAILGALVQMALCGGALLLLREGFYRLRGIDGLGLGDVKLGAAAGAWIGVQGFAFAVLLAALAALVFVAVARRREGGWAPERQIPFAFYLAPSIWACWFLLRLVPAS